MPISPKKSPMLAAAPLVEWRANRISDPIERLRFLRRAAAYRSAVPAGFVGFVKHAAVAIFVVGLMVPLALVSDASALWRKAPPVPLTIPARKLEATAADAIPNIWQVEKSRDQEVYSNGLRVETKYIAAPLGPRPAKFVRYKADDLATEESASPFGIVYHTTESHMLPFEASRNSQLKYTGENLAGYVRAKRAYHYLIDRFGRVYQILPDAEHANHSGSSIWGDGKWSYLHLNTAFLAVAFEARTKPEPGQSVATAAQVLAARLLTETLRSRYRIDARNCVTHAQVSVNPTSFLIGEHTDWAADFPFESVGLNDNYESPIAAIGAFGFTADSIYLTQTGKRLWKGILLGEERLRLDAAARGITAGQHRRILQQRYKDMLTGMRIDNSGEEKN